MDFSNFISHLEKLDKEIYEQPSDPGHTDWASDFISAFLPSTAWAVLDVGCGDGFCQEVIKQINPDITYRGITKSEKDIETAESFGRDVQFGDMSFLPYWDGYFDIILARHVLEHSPMPLITLMEWHRVSNEYLMLVLPAPEYWERGGQNHYYVLEKEDWKVLFDASGWEILKEGILMTSDFLFEKHYHPNWDYTEGPKPIIDPPQAVEFRYLLGKKSVNE